MSSDEGEGSEMTVEGRTTGTPGGTTPSTESSILGKVAKLLLILGCYTVLFSTLVMSARWFLTDFVRKGAELTHLFDWLQCSPECEPKATDVLRTLTFDSLLFFVFMAQHSLLSERNLVGTSFHRKFYLEWKVNGAFYTLATAVTLQGVMMFWRTVPIYLWNWPTMKPVLNYVHLAAWLILYGTTLMQDFPDLIGLNQVIFSNESTSQKSPEFKAMLKRQRHLGLVPFFMIIVTCEIMTLDRLLFLVIFLVYCCSMWRDPTGFQYIKLMISSKRDRLHGKRD